MSASKLPARVSGEGQRENPTGAAASTTSPPAGPGLNLKLPPALLELTVEQLECLQEKEEFLELLEEYEIRPADLRPFLVSTVGDVAAEGSEKAGAAGATAGQELRGSSRTDADQAPVDVAPHDETIDRAVVDALKKQADAAVENALLAMQLYYDAEQVLNEGKTLPPGYVMRIKGQSKKTGITKTSAVISAGDALVIVSNKHGEGALRTNKQARDYLEKEIFNLTVTTREEWKVASLSLGGPYTPEDIADNQGAAQLQSSAPGLHPHSTSRSGT